MNGPTALRAVDLAGVDKSTAAYSFHRLRAIIVCQIEQELHEVFGDAIDTSEFGGCRKSNRGRDAGGKVAVLGFLKRGGKMYTTIIRDAHEARH